MNLRRNEKRYKGRWVVFFAFFVLFCLMGEREVHAQGQEKNEKKVRVGWYQSDMFQEGISDDQMKRGYCYDYLQKVSDYTNWEYEYVYGNWTELFHMLQRGEIDCMGGVSVTEERKDTMLFPDTAMGTDQYYLYKRTNDVSVSPTDLSTFAGKKVGGIRDNQITAFTLKWMQEKAVDLEIVYFDSFEEQEKAFEAGEIDLLAQTINNVLTMEGIDIAAKVGEDPFYLAISKERPDLLAELNESINTILSIDPFVLQNLQYVNYGATLINKTLTDEEKEWVKNHSRITVAYLDNYLPYSDTSKDGQAMGILTDTLNAILESLELDDQIAIDYIPYQNFDQMAEALRAGLVDIAFPVYGNLWELEKNKIDASAAVVQSSETFVYKGVYDRNKVRKISVNENNQMQIAYCKKYFPDVELVYFGSIEECLSEVMHGKVDGTIVNTLRTELVTGNVKYKSLSFVQLKGDDSRCFGVNENNTELILILNRGLRMIGSSFGIESSYKYMEEFYIPNLGDYFLKYINVFLPILILVVGGIILLLAVNLHRKAVQVSEKEAHIRQVQALNEELSELRRKADAANEAKTKFLFDMSHDIRTPMNAILGFTGLMEKNLDNPEVLRDEIGKVKFSGEYLITLINNMLEIARIDSGKEELSESFVDLADETHSVIPVFQEEIQKKNLTVTREIQIQNRYVYADLHKAMEIVMNLLSNAIKYTPDGGSIFTKLCEIPCETEGYAAYEFSIRDTGIGMSPEYQKIIFESFSRERNTTESKIAGTGLGMAIVKRLVNLMNGTVEVESELGKGSCFTVRTKHRIVENPADYLETAQSQQRDEPLDLSGKRILLAEDNELNTEIASAILEDYGAQVEHAKDGLECITMLTERAADHYDLILMDVQMPNLNGYEATKRIRQLPDPIKSNIPIIAMTANAFDEDKKNAFDAGMNEHLSKPIEIARLVKVLKKVL